MFDLLKGVRIVDLSTIVLGPYATQLLGDFGAEVIKVEAPGGDLFRKAGAVRAGGDGAGFLNLNRNKRSIELDVRRGDGLATLMRLIATADVVVHNMRPKSAEKLGIGYDAVRAVRPGVVYCTARGFGAGPQGDEPAYDDCIQAASGIAHLNADAAGDPRYVPTVLCDKVAGLHLALAIAAGLAARVRTGNGSHIETPMYEAMVSFLMVEHLGGATFDPPRGGMGYDRLKSHNRRPFATSDGYIAIMPYTTAHWQRYLRLIGRDDMADDVRVTDPANRSAHIDMLYGIIAQASSAHTTAEWIAVLGAEDIPHARVNQIDDLLSDPQLIASGMFARIEHPAEGQLLSVASPFAVRDRQRTDDRAAPLLGADAEQILSELEQRA